MDNKENRQFYWEVKNFVGKKHDPISKQPASKPNLVENVKSVLNQNSLYRQSNFNPNLTSLNSVSQAINIINHTNHEGNPNCPAYTKNVHRNAFGIIKESISTLPRYSQLIQASLGKTLDSGFDADFAPREAGAFVGTKPTTAPVDPDRYDPNLDPDAERGYGPEEESGADDTEKGKLSGTPRTERDDIRDDIVGNLKRAYGMPSPINVSGSERSAAAAERNAAIRDANIAAEAERNRMKQEMLNAKTPEEKAAAMRALRNFNDRTMRGSGENLGGARAALASRPDIAPKKQFSPETVIQGTNITYGDWEKKYGHPYNPMDEGDRTIAVRGHSMMSGQRYAPGAAESLATSVAFNQTAAERAQREASSMGALDRSIQQQQAEMERIKTDPEYRKKLRDAEIARIQSQPGFVQNIAQQMK